MGVERPRGLAVDLLQLAPAPAADRHQLALLHVDKGGVSDNEPLIWHGSRFRELAEEDSIDITGVMRMPVAAWTP